jgi:uncharacterized protein YukE
MGNHTPGVPSAHVGTQFPDTSRAELPSWGPVAVEAGANLVVDSDYLRSQYAPELSNMAGVLHQAVADAAPGALAKAAIAPIAWGPVQTLADAVGTAHKAMTGYTSGLAVANDSNAANLKTAADIYDDADNSVAQSAKTLAKLQTTWQGSPASATADQTTLVMYGGAGDTQNNIPAAAYQTVLRVNSRMPGDPMNQPTWTYQTQVTGNTVPSGDVSHITLSDVKTLLNQGNVKNVQDAAAAHNKLYVQLSTATSQLKALGPEIASTWKGSAAVGMVTQVQSMYQTAQGLQQNAYLTSTTLNWYGNTVLPAFQKGLSDLTTQFSQNGTHPAEQNSLAQKFIAQLTPHIQTAYLNLPPSVNSTVQPPASRSGRSIIGSVSGNRAPSGGGLPGNGVSSGTTPGGQSGSSLGPPGSSSSGANPGGRISLAGTPVPGNTTTPVGQMTTTPLPGTTTLPGQTVGPFTTPAMPGGTGGLGDGDAGTGDLGTGGDSFDMPGMGGLGSSSASATPEAASAAEGVAAGDGAGAGDTAGLAGEDPAGFPGMGMGMGGMGGLGSSGSGGLGRTRQAWDSEDDEVWNEGAFGADAPAVGEDGMIGGLGAPSAAFGPGNGFETGDAFATGGFSGGAGAGAGADGAGMDNGGMFPFGGGAGAGGRNENGRNRQAWMEEDADVWAPGGQGVPPVIG